MLNFEPKHPATSHPLDLEAAAVAHDQFNRWYLDPITGRGYPEAVRGTGSGNATRCSTATWRMIAAPLDFLGVNYYCREVVHSPLLPPLDPPTRPPERTGMGWEVYPAGLTEVLEFVASRTGDLPLYVTENGAAYPLGDDRPARDPERVSYLHRHLEAAAVAMEQGVPLRGYFVWSLLDNFEWALGYAHRFGIVHVDFDTLERTVRDSGTFWSIGRAERRPPRGASGFVVAVDRQARLRVEEVQPGDVDDQFDRLAIRRGGPWVQPGEELRMPASRCSITSSVVVTDVVRQLLRVLGHDGQALAP